jgi:hypothetical protein
MQEWENLLFEVRRSIRYHSKRANFFSFLNKLFMAVSIIAGSSVVAMAINGDKIFSMALGIIVAVMSTISLVFGYSSNEQLHNELKRKFIKLEKSMVKCENPDNKILGEKNAKRLSIETNEIEIIESLNSICYNEQAKAQGSKERIKINWFRTLFCQIDLYATVSFFIIVFAAVAIFLCFLFTESPKVYP